MKRSVILLFTMALVWVEAADALAKRNRDSGPGCGIGTTLWADYDHPKNIAPQILMFTTNATLFNTVSMSFGVSGCTNDGVIMAEHKVHAFVAVNFEDLSQDIAQGQGEHLASLATLMGVPPEDQPEFFAMTQQRYITLMTSGEASPIALVRALERNELATRR